MKNKELLTWEEDQWLQDLYVYKPRLQVILNNNQMIYDDDDRPGLEIPCFWRRLKLFLADNQYLKIKEIQYKFRSRIESILPKKAQGYYFSKYLFADTTGLRQDGWVLGYLQGEEIHRTIYWIPSLVPFQSHVKHISEVEQEFLIK